MSTSMLPRGYESLEGFVNQWAVQGSAERDKRRCLSTEREREDFFEAAKGLAEPALQLLDEKPLHELDDNEKRLLDLMLSFAHIALAVEIHGKAEAMHSITRQRMHITKSPADSPPL